MRATPANKKAAAEDNYLCGSFLVRPNTFLNQKSSYLCVLVEQACQSNSPDIRQYVADMVPTYHPKTDQRA